MRRFLCLIAVLGIFACGTARAVPFTVDFEGDATGMRANGFASAGAAGLTFSDTVGSDLGIFELPEGAGLRSLLVGLDQDGSALEMLFVSEIDILSLSFGNDGTSNTNDGDLAVLTLFLGSSQVGQVMVGLNRDDLMNQSIAFGSIGNSVFFNRAVFGFTNSSGSPFTGGGNTNVGASEVVDNIMFNTVDRDGVAVPEPATGLLFLAGLAAILGRSRRAKPG